MDGLEGGGAAGWQMYFFPHVLKNGLISIFLTAVNKPPTLVIEMLRNATPNEPNMMNIPDDVTRIRGAIEHVSAHHISTAVHLFTHFCFIFLYVYHTCSLYPQLLSHYPNHFTSSLHTIIFQFTCEINDSS